jgi:energy-coupling factor transporter ATP-binding protein EcfA2
VATSNTHTEAEAGACSRTCVRSHVTLRAGEVLEVCGESGSGKTEVVMMAAVVAVLPRQYDGVSYGGNEGGVVVMDLDGKFNMHRFMQLLHARLTATHAAICRERRSVPLLPTPAHAHPAAAAPMSACAYVIHRTPSPTFGPAVGARMSFKVSGGVGDARGDRGLAQRPTRRVRRTRDGGVRAVLAAAVCGAPLCLRLLPLAVGVHALALSTNAVDSSLVSTCMERSWIMRCTHVVGCQSQRP